MIFSLRIIQLLMILTNTRATQTDKCLLSSTAFSCYSSQLLYAGRLIAIPVPQRRKVKSKELNALMFGSLCYQSLFY